MLAYKALPLADTDAGSRTHAHHQESKRLDAPVKPDLLEDTQEQVSKGENHKKGSNHEEGMECNACTTMATSEGAIIVRLAGICC